MNQILTIFAAIITTVVVFCGVEFTKGARAKTRNDTAHVQAMNAQAAQQQRIADALWGQR